MVQMASPPAWAEIFAHRRRDRLVILPLSLLAAAGAGMWLGPLIAGIWLSGILGVLLLGWALCERIGQQPCLTRRHKWMIATETFLTTALYSSLPLMLIVHGQRDSVLAAACIVGAMALSSVSEYVLSRLIGGAALAGAFFPIGLAMALTAGEHSAGSTAFGIAAMGGFAFYVVQSGGVRSRTERRLKAALHAARAAEEAAAEASAAKSTFLAVMSHEIRTPLNGVLGMAQAMAGDTLSPEQRRRLGILRRSGQALTAILNDVLDLTKIEAGHMEILKADFQLEEVIEAVAAGFRPLAEAKGLALDVAIAPQACGHYEGDAARLRQVLSNLVSNAVKFTDAGHVRIEAVREGGLLHLSVADTGPGIPAEAMGKLFGSFVQLDASPTRRHGGTGLGLAISKALSEAMGGTIQAGAAPGGGAVFRLSLPLPYRPGVLPEPPRETCATGCSCKVNRSLRILAAEDNEINQEVLRAILEPAGLAPTIVTDGAQALQAWEDSHWDVILMDVHMPVMDGMTAVAAIRERETATGRARTPVIALTANAMTHQIDELLAAGMDLHVAKPIQIGLLLEALDRAIALGEAEPVAPRELVAREA